MVSFQENAFSSQLVSFCESQIATVSITYVYLKLSGLFVNIKSMYVGFSGFLKHVGRFIRFCKWPVINYPLWMDYLHFFPDFWNQIAHLFLFWLTFNQSIVPFTA